MKFAPILLLATFLSHCGKSNEKIATQTKTQKAATADQLKGGKGEPKIKVNGKVWDGKSDINSDSVTVLGF